MNLPTRTMTQFGKAYLERRYAVLFYSLLGSLALVPILSATGLSSRGVSWFLLVNIVLAGNGAQRSNRVRFFSAIGLVVLLRLLGHFIDSAGIVDGSTFALAALTLFAVVGSFIFAMRSPTIDSEHVYAALSAYLLAGQFFGLLAIALEYVAPGSYSGVSLKEPGVLPLSQGIYFSYVTLATLGYGDIVPANDMARGIAVVEAVAGQLYIAVLVARLVSGYRSKTQP